MIILATGSHFENLKGHARPRSGSGPNGSYISCSMIINNIITTYVLLQLASARASNGPCTFWLGVLMRAWGPRVQVRSSSLRAQVLHTWPWTQGARRKFAHEIDCMNDESVCAHILPRHAWSSSKSSDRLRALALLRLVPPNLPRPRRDPPRAKRRRRWQQQQRSAGHGGAQGAPRRRKRLPQVSRRSP